MSFRSNSCTSTSLTSSCHLVHSSIVSAKEGIVLCVIHPYGRPNVSRTSLVWGNEPMVVVGSAGSLKASLDFFTFCKKLANSGLLLSKLRCDMKFSICSRHVLLQRVPCWQQGAAPWPLRMAWSRNSPNFQPSGSKIAGSKSSLAAVNGTWRRGKKCPRQLFQLEQSRFLSSFHSCCMMFFPFTIPA